MHTASKRVAALTFLIVTTLSLIWIGGILLVPLLEASHLDQSAPLSLIRTSYGRVCHQIEDRSFHIGGHALAVCARCTGIYAGFVAAMFVYPFARSIRRTDLPARSWLIFALVPVSVDFIAGYFGFFQTALISRALTGFVAGAAGPFYTLPGLVCLAASALKPNQTTAVIQRRAKARFSESDSCPTAFH